MAIKYLLISGVRINSVPVLVDFISWVHSRDDSVKVLEHKGRYGLLFVIKAILQSIQYRHCIHIFANTQAALPLRLIQCLPIKINNIVYWAIESTSYANTFSPVWLGIWSEKILRHKEVDLVVPIEERRNFFSLNYNSVYVIENVPLLGRRFIKRDLNPCERIKLVVYGGLSSETTYVLEILDLVSRWPKLYELTLIGNLSGVDTTTYERENIKFLGRVSHDRLIDLLSLDFHFSIVGYKPISFNYEYCAPNKLFESFSLSLPVIGNVLNPTIHRVLKEWHGGIVANFNSLDGEWLYTQLVNDYHKCNINAYNAHINRYNLNQILDHTICFDK